MEKRMVSVEKAFGPISERVRRFGGEIDPEGKNIAVWRQAFPKIQFLVVDKGLTESSIPWEKFSLEDKATRVAMDMGVAKLARSRDGRRVTVDYELGVKYVGQNFFINHQVDDTEKQWELWLEDALHETQGRRIFSIDARRGLVHNALQNDRYSALDEPTDILNEEEVWERSRIYDEHLALMNAGEMPQTVHVRRLSIQIPEEVIEDLAKSRKRA